MILGSWIRSSFLLINKKFILKPSPNFKNKGLQNGFIIVDALVLSIFGAFSTASNGFLVFIMIKYKKEFETCHYLLGVNAVCDMIVSSSGIVTALLLAVFGTFHFTNIQCVWYHSFALIAFNMSFVLVFLIAADRFFAVLFRCSAADLWQGKYFTVLKPFCLSFTIAAVFCYVAIWIQIRYRKKPSTNEEKQRTEIIKSLTILLLLILFGWIFNMAMRSVIPMLIPQPVPLGFFLMNTTDIVLTFIGIANTFVLYICR
uniref:G_PROTEIN_RECEP_F1_2 domain-containing protein n=1 Tax=Meloidogyne hapla TaxID=6305 RepID=A0A1I8BCY5_MELHA